MRVHENHMRGNALFLILIAVLLFATLGYAVTKSGRGSGDTSREMASISAGEAVHYADVLRTNVTRMLLSGTPYNAVDFSPGTGTGKVFDPAEGQSALEPPPQGLGNVTAWIFEDARDSVNGYYIKDVGTNTDVAGRDIIAVLHDISLVACTQMLKGLGLNQTPAALPVVVDWSTGAAPVFTATGASNTVAGAGIDGQAFSCIRNGGVYDYYHALAER